MGEAAGRDTVWEEGLAAALGSTDLPLTAVLDEQKMSLKDIINIRVGETLHLKCGPDAEVEIRSGEVSLATGRLGRSGTRYAVRVERNLLNSPAGRKGAA